MNDEFRPPTNGFNMVIDDGCCNPNVTPAKTVCTMSLRTMPNDCRDEAVDIILKAGEKYGLESRHIIVEPFYVSIESEILQAALDITGCKSGETAPYGTEALFYQDYVNLVIFGPGDINQAHSVGEWIDIEQIRMAELHYFQLIKRFCCQHPKPH
jgi:acetylornithine deacetylase/succinyl-diaminopimelate desuccinylase-like protein